MPRGISLHVGINQASSAFPGARKLTGPENDAREMKKIAEAKGFNQCDLLLGPEATYARVTTKIRSAATQLEAGDIFLFTFAGHGFQEANTGFDPADPDIEDGVDETLLLFDVELFDDVLRKDLWPSFKPDVRILMIADCCHSGDIFLVPPPLDDGDDDLPVATAGQQRIRAITIATGQQHLKEYAEFYRNTLLPVLNPISASLMLLAACKPSDVTLDGDPNGMYTAAMVEVLKKDLVDYDDLVKAIKDELKNRGRPTQMPLLQVAGAGPTFRGEKPFTI